jgi:hypothetical protein
VFSTNGLFAGSLTNGGLGAYKGQGVFAGPFTSLIPQTFKGAFTTGAVAQKQAPKRSDHQRTHNLTGYISQAEVAALELEREAFVIDAQAAEHRCLDVVNVDRV